MKKRLSALLLVLILCISCSSCGNNSAAASSSDTDTDTADEVPISVELPDTEEEFTDRDYDTDYTIDTTITLSDSGSTADGRGVTIDGSTITITSEGTFLVTGTLSDGQIIIDADDGEKVQIVLSNASINCNSSSAAILAEEADKVFITLAEESDNTLSSSVSSEDGSVDGTLFALCDLTLNGAGTLTVSSSSGHGIVCKDDLRITSGTYMITSAKKGIDANDSIRIADGTLTIISGTDAIHCENEEDSSLGYVLICNGELSLTAGTDGIDCSGALFYLGGTLDIYTGEGSSVTSSKNDDWGQFGFSASSDSNTESMKGMKSGLQISICDGTININSEDDAIHCGGTIDITGGIMNLSSGDDGIHADDTLTISGGTISVTQSYEGLEASVINIQDGDISIISSDDGLNAAGGSDSSSLGGRMGANMFESDSDSGITINGGSLYVNADGDGLDSNGYLLITGGAVYVSGPTSSANGALDYTTGGTITGGTIVAAGASGMAQNFDSDSTQGSIFYAFSSTVSGGTAVTLSDSAGNVIVTFTPDKSYNSVVISSPEITENETYMLTIGSETTEIEMTSLLYSNSNGSFGMMGGGMQQSGGGMRGGMTMDNSDSTDLPDMDENSDEFNPSEFDSSEIPSDFSAEDFSGTGGMQPNGGNQPSGDMQPPDSNSSTDGMDFSGKIQGNT